MSGISRGKVKKIKNSRGFSKSYILNPLVWIFSGITHYEKGKSKSFLENMGQVLGRLASSTFDKKRIIPYLEFSPGTVKLLLRYCQAIIFFINPGLDLGRDMK